MAEMGSALGQRHKYQRPMRAGYYVDAPLSGIIFIPWEVPCNNHIKIYTRYQKPLISGKTTN